jgi:ParB family chromosome partitioning protein
MLRVAPPEKKAKGGLSSDLEAAVDAMKSVPWTALQELKGDPDILRKIGDVEALLQSLRKALS